MDRRTLCAPLPATAAALLLVAFGTASAAAFDPVRTPADETPRLVRFEGGLRVESGTDASPLVPPPGAAVESVAGLGAGWLVAGTRDEGDRRELWLLVGGAGEAARELPPPPSPRGRERVGPVPVVANGELAGVAWLEGDSRRTYAVRWARWLGRVFDEPIEISPPGPGSQLALTAVRLDDGRALLAWSGFDGTDDEVWTSVVGADGASKPARAGEDNAVPDITPTAVATPGGAWIAWSRFDRGEYRTAVARYAGGQLGAARLVGSPGAIQPRFERGGETPLLVWRDARADLWTLGELASDGSLVTLATASGAESERPAVVREGNRVRLVADASRTPTPGS